MAAGGAAVGEREHRTAQPDQLLPRGHDLVHHRRGDRHGGRRLFAQSADQSRQRRRRRQGAGRCVRHRPGRAHRRSRRQSIARPVADRSQQQDPGFPGTRTRARDPRRRQYRPAAADLSAGPCQAAVGRQARNLRRWRRPSPGLGGRRSRLDRGQCRADRSLDRSLARRISARNRFRLGRRAAAERRALAQAVEKGSDGGERRSMKGKQAEPVHGLGPKLAPGLLTATLALLSVVPVGIPDYTSVTPNFVLMSVYHWSIYRPEHLPYAAVFLIGLLFDLLTTAPGSVIGSTPLLLLILRATVIGQSRFFVGRGFPLIWWGFALAVAVYDLLIWLVDSALSGSLLEPRSLTFQAVLTIALFPLLTLLFARVQRATASAA